MRRRLAMFRQYAPRPLVSWIVAWTVVLWMGVLWTAASSAGARGEPADGARIGAVDEGSPLQVDDRLLAWRGEGHEPSVGRSGIVRDGFDLLELKAWAPAFPRLHLTVDRRGRIRPVLWEREELAVEPAVPVLDAEPPSEPVARAWRAYHLARAADRDGRPDEADGHWQAAVDGCLEAERPTAAALVLHAWASARDDFTFEADVARGLFQKALDLLDAVGEPGLPSARIQLDLGTSFLKRGDSPGSVEALERSLAPIERWAPDTVLLSRNLNNLALAVVDLGRLGEGESLYRRQLEIVQKLEPESLRLARVFNNLGNLAYARGDLGAAEEHHRRAKDLRERLAPESLALARSLNNLAGVAEDRGEGEKAELWYRRALELRRRLDPGGTEVLTTLVNLALLSADRGDGERAVEWAAEAHDLAVAAAPDTDTEAWTAKVLAHVLLQGEPSAEQLREAETAARRSVALHERQAPGSLVLGDSLEVLARVHARRDRLDQAELLLRRVLDLRARVAPESRWQAGAHQALAELLWRRDRPRPALDQLERALALAESALEEPDQSPRERAVAAASFVDWYRQAALWWTEQGRIELAFERVERSRAWGLAALLGRRSLDLERDLPPELEQERRRLAADYGRAWQEARALGADDPGHGAALARLNELRDARQRLDRRAASHRPRLDPGRFVLGADELRARLDPGVLVLSYTVVEREVLLLAALGAGADRPAELRAHRLERDREPLADRVEAFRTVLQSVAGDPAPLAAGLYGELLAPVEDLLARADRLVIVPDRELHRLPFAALVDGEGRYLVERLPVSRAPSASVGSVVRDAPPADPTLEKLVVFGDPRPDEHPLPWSRREARRLRALHPGPTELLLGDRARESRFRALGPEVDLLHFAGHAEVDDRFPLDSHLALAADREHNGRLQAWEIFESLRLDARLVTLSGCETGLGKAVDGAGLAGLTRAFLFAGARAVVSTQWQVDDRATALLVARFYRHLAHGQSADRALREAQLDLLKSRATWSEESDDNLLDRNLLDRNLLDRLSRLVRGTDTPDPDADPDPDPGKDAAHPGHWAAFQITFGGG